VNDKIRVFEGGNWDLEVLGAKEPVLVDFWAEWCGPCRAIAPSIDALAEAFAGRLKVGKLNVDNDGEVAQRYGITSIPTLLVFSGGRVVAQRVGGMALEDLKRFVEPHVAANAVH